MGVISPVFERILSADTIEAAATATLQKWFKTYLREIERQHDIPYHLPDPRSWNVRPDNDKWTEDMLPAVVVVSPGTVDEPLMEGDGSYRAFWSLGAALFNAAPDEATVRTNSKAYGATIRGILLQKRSLGGLADNNVWLGEDYDYSGDMSLRMFGACTVNFLFQVSYVVNKEAGPLYPDEEPGQEWPIALQSFAHVNEYTAIGPRHEPPEEEP